MIRLRQDYQEPGVQALFDYFASGAKGNPLAAYPTGTGKSLIIGGFCQRVLQTWPNTKIIVATHVKELVEQNCKTMLKLWPTAPVGIYSAGLGSRDTIQSIIFGSIQSIVGAQERFGLRHMMLVDEAHLVSPKAESSYQQVIANFKKVNPNFKTIGFTATAYRTGQGPIAGPGNLFTDTVVDLTGLKEFNWFIDQGYLVPLIPKRTMTELDVSNVCIQNSDFAANELQAAVDKSSITYQCCREMIEYGAQRRSWLVFASGVEHAEHVAQCLQTLGIRAESVHAKLSKSVRDERVTSFKNGTIRCIVNNNVLTTGFDFPGLDFIGMLRPTTSTGLWVQMLGRGTRPDYRSADERNRLLFNPVFYDLETQAGRLAAIAASQKPNCLVLDFAANTRRLGPINDPVKPKTRLKGATPGVAPIKLCPVCGCYCHANATECSNPACAHKFERQSKLKQQASEAELIRSDFPVEVEMQVNRILYTKLPLKGRPPMLRVSYFCGLEIVKETLAFENTGYARTVARKWWREHSSTEPPETIDSALKQQNFLAQEKVIVVLTNQKHPEIKRRIWH